MDIYDFTIKNSDKEQIYEVYNIPASEELYTGTAAQIPGSVADLDVYDWEIGDDGKIYISVWVEV